jgi:glycosyltransferase involved in cell wall biosynthesis
MLFVHSHQFIKHDGRYYTSGSLNNKLFERYINIFGVVTVFANQKEVTENDLKQIDDQNKVDNVHLRLMHNKNNIFEIIKNRNKVKEAVSENKYIIIRMPSFYGVLAVMYAQKSNKKYLIELVGCPWDALWNHSWKGKLVAPFMWHATKKAVRNAPYVLYVTNEFLQGRYPSTGKTIGCSDVALPTLDESVLEIRLHKIKQMTKHKPIVLGTTAAVNVRYKGQEYVIHAIAELNKQGYNFEYRLVGGGDKTRLQSIAEKYGVADKVIFHGSLPHEKVFDYLDNIDIYVQPSQTEGLPRALIEAMSRGCPCIGSNAGGIPELLDNAHIFSSGNVKELATILASFDIEKMITQAKRNYEFSKGYAKEIIETRRNDFLKEFAEGATKHD